MADLKVKLFSAASVFAGFQPLLRNSSNVFQWADVQLPQQWDITNFSAVRAFQVSDPSQYVIDGRLSSSWTRMQFMIYGHGNDSTNASAVVAVMKSFFKGFNASANVSRSGFYDNRISNDRDGGVADTQPLTFLRTMDVQIFNDENV